MSDSSRPHGRSRRWGARAVLLTASLALVASPLTGAAATDPGVRPVKWFGEGEAPAPAPVAPALAVGLIVTYGSGKAATAVSSVATGARAAGVTVSPRGVAISSTASSVRFDEPKDLAEAETLAAELAALPGVVSVAPDRISYPAAAAPVRPNDEYFDLLHNIWDRRDAAQVPEPVRVGWPAGGYSVKAPVLWQTTTGSANLVVAILDTGGTAHLDLDANTVAGYDFVSDADRARDGGGRDANPQDEGDWSSAGECYQGSPARDSSWHGTHVAGTVAARMNDGRGVVGVAPNVKIQHVRVLAKCGGANSDIAAAITWASGGSVPGVPVNRTPAKVLNLSLGGQGTCDTVTQAAINGARSRGSVVIVAAGNDRQDAVHFSPANCRDVITVGATDYYGLWASYTNYGGTLDVSAPGGDLSWETAAGVLSTINTGTTVPGSPHWTFYQGTSMATPAVAGAAALIASLGSFTAPQLEQAIRAAVRPFPTYGTNWDCDRTCGLGITDLSLVPAPRVATTVSGTAKVGSKLTANPAGSWLGAPTSFSYQWLRGGSVISGATAQTYTVTKADIGKSLQFRVLANKAGFPPIPSTSAATKVVPKVATKITAKLKKKTVKRTAKAKVVIKVTTTRIAKPTGKIKVTYGKKSKTFTLKAKHKGKITVTLPKLKKGTYKIKAKYTPSGSFKTYTKAKTSKTVKLKVKK